MTDRINGLNTPPAGAGSGGSVARSRDPALSSTPPAPPAPGNAAAGDIHSTDTASRLAALEQTVRELPAIDQARVDELRSAIEQGRYVVRPENVATRLLQMEQALRRLADPQNASSDSDGQK